MANWAVACQLLAATQVHCSSMIDGCLTHCDTLIPLYSALRCEFDSRKKHYSCSFTFTVYLHKHLLAMITLCVVVLVVQQFGVGLVIERSLVRILAGALSSQLGQLSLPSLWGR